MSAAEGDDSLMINLHNADLRRSSTISRERLNIIASRAPLTVTANLNGAISRRALSAILKSTRLVAAREGNIIYV